MAHFASGRLTARTAAIYVDNSSDYSKSLAREFETTFIRNGGVIIAKEAYLQKDVNFRSALARIAAQSPDVIFVPGYYQEVGLIVRQARELSMQMPILGGDGWDSPRIVQYAGAVALNNTFHVNHFSPDDRSSRMLKFVAAYRAEYGVTPDAVAALGYDAALLLIDAIKRADSTDGSKIAKALAQTRNLRVVTGKLTINDTHDPIKSAVIITMVNGKQVFYTRIDPQEI